MEKKILITGEGKRFYVRDLTKDFHTQYGVIKAKDLKKKDGSRILTNTKKELTIFSSIFIDDYRKIERAPQIIPLKDVGQIIAETGINKNSIVVDAGSGSGALACFLAHLAKEVTTYEIRDDFCAVVKNNKKFFGLNNLKIKKQNIYRGIDEKNVDLITLDLPSPWNAIKPAEKALKIGGFLVSYSPTIPQVMDFVSVIKNNKNFIYIKTIEIMERSWEIEERKVRPRSQQIGHSGFLSFCRRI